MKRVALLFVLAVFVPSLVLAWLAVRSLRDQQFVLERQQSLLLQGLADQLARDAETYLDERQREFVSQVETLLAGTTPADLSRRFDDVLRQAWPFADVGFAVTLSGNLLSPSPMGRPDARNFCLANSAFLGNREQVEVYANLPKAAGNYSRQGDKTMAQQSSSANQLAQAPQPGPSQAESATTTSTNSRTNTPSRIRSALSRRSRPCCRKVR